MGKNSIGKWGSALALWGLLTFGGWEMDKNKPVNLTVDRTKWAMSNLLSNEAYAATLDNSKIKASELETIDWSSNNAELLKTFETLKLSPDTIDKVLKAIDELNNQGKIWYRFVTIDNWRSISVTNDWWSKVIIEDWKTDNEKESNKSNLTVSHSIDTDWDKITKYEQWWKGFELKEKWNDAIITYFWFNWWHTEWDQNLWQKASDKFSADAIISWNITNNISLWWWAKLWSKQLAFLAFSWVDLWKFGQVVLFWENYRENNTFDTSVWEKDAWENQGKVAWLYKHNISDWVLNSVEVEGSYTKWSDTKIFSEQSTESNTTVTETPESIITRTTTNTYKTTWTSIGWEELQGVISLVLKLSENQKLTTWLQVTDREYNNWTELWTKIGWVASYEVVIKDLNKFKFWVSADDVQQRYTTWVSRKVSENGEIWVNAFYSNNEEWQDNYWAMIGYTHSFSTGWKIEKESNNKKWYKLFPENWVNINQVAVNFAREQSSQGLDTPREYVEETKLVSSETTEDVKIKPKPKPAPEAPKPTPENPENVDAKDDSFSAKVGEQVFLNLTWNDANVDSISKIEWLTSGCHADISWTWVNFTWDNAWTCNFKYRWIWKWGDDWANVSVNVSDNPPAETPPIMWDVQDVTVNVWESFTVNIWAKVTWTDWDPYTCNIPETMPAWLTFNSSACSITWTLSAPWAHTFHASATDNDGTSSIDEFTVTAEAAANNPPTWEDKTVDANFTNACTTTLNLTDPDTWDTVTGNVTWSGAALWDVVIWTASIVWNVATIIASSGTWHWYMEYKAIDDKWLESIATYRVTCNTMDWE